MSIEKEQNPVSSISPIPDSQKGPTLQENIPLDEEGFTEEERLEITRQIDDAAKRSSIGSVGPFNPEKKGVLFPLVVNILAVLAIGAGVYLSNYYFNQRVEELNTVKNELQSAEGKILEEVKKESEKKLQAKEKEISKIREDLKQIEQERQNLQLNMQQQIAMKEEELQRDLAEALARERARLESEGITQEEMKNRLGSFRAEQQQQYQSALAEYRQESLRQLEAKEKELAEAKATAEQILSEASRERQQLLQDAQQREEELRRQFQQETERLSRESSTAQQELTRLEEIRKNEQLYRNQIDSLYLEIGSAIQAGDSAAARRKIEELRNLIQSPAITQLSSFAHRREVDSFLLSVLEEHAVGSAGAGEDESLLESAKTMATLKSTVAEAQEMENEGKLYEARRYYSRAMELIPVVQTAAARLEEIGIAEESSRIQEILAEAKLAREENRREEALELYRSAAVEAAVDHRELGRTAAEGILALTTLELEELRQELESQIAAQKSDMEKRLSAREKELQDLRQAYDELQARSSDEQTALNESVVRKEQEIAGLQRQIDEKEGQISNLQEELQELEREKIKLSRRYQEAQAEISKLNSDLEGAVDQIAELVTLGESNSRLRSAVVRYDDFVRESHALLSSSDWESREAGQKKFEEFLDSREVKEIFPQLSDLYKQIAGR
jgi:hypothetical protein